MAGGGSRSGERRGGRRRGTPNKATAVIRSLALGSGEAAFERIVGLIDSTDERIALSASLAVIDRAYGKSISARTVELDLPATDTPAGLRQAVRCLVHAATSGEITTGEAIDLCRLLELEKKIGALIGEGTPGAADNKPAPPAVIDFEAFRRALREAAEDVSGPPGGP